MSKVVGTHLRGPIGSRPAGLCRATVMALYVVALLTDTVAIGHAAAGSQGPASTCPARRLPCADSISPLLPDTNTHHLYVSSSGSDSNAGTSSAPFKTIQKAASAATAGTTVHVAPGVYNEVIHSSKDGTASDPINYVSDVKGGAVIKPSGATGAIWSDSGAYVTIQGFEIDGTNSPNSREGLMLTGAHSKVVNNLVHHILMAGSTDANGGAGILLGGGYYNHWDQDAIGNTVHDVGNNSPRVHGIYHQGTGAIINNVVYSTSQTGIVGWHDPHDILIANNTVFHNQNGIAFGAGDSYHSGAVADNMRVINNIVYDNRSAGIAESGLTGTNNVYVDNLVYKNGSDWSLQNGLKPQGTVTADPHFVSYNPTGSGDYHLAANSPAINTGTTAYAAPTTDIHGRIRINPDIGAIESCIRSFR